ELLAKPAKGLRVAAAELVFDLDPAVAGRLDLGARGAAEARDELGHGLLDRGLVVRLDEDATERVARRATAEPRVEFVERDEEPALVLDEAQPLVDREGRMVRREHIQVEVRTAVLARERRGLGEQC